MSLAYVVIGVAAVLIAVYIVYKVTKEDDYKGGPGSGATPNVRARELISVDDILSENPGLRQRQIHSAEAQKEVVRNLSHDKNTETESLLKGENKSFHSQDAQTESLLNGENNLLCSQDTQTTESLLNGENNLLRSQDTQTTESLLNGENNLLHTQATRTTNYVSNLNEAEENVANDGDASSYRSESCSSQLTISSDTSYPTWTEMNPAERKAFVCRPCGRPVTTITFPCHHPYMCEICAPQFINFYSYRCPICKKKIKGYDSVSN